MYQGTFNEDEVSLSDMDKKPQASTRLEKKTEVIPYLESGGMPLKDIIIVQHQDLVMAINKQTEQLFSLSDAMNKFNDLMEKVARMVVHMDVVQDKLFKMSDAIYQAVIAGDGVDNAAAASIPNKVQKLTHPDLIELRDKLAAIDLPEDQSRKKFHNAFVKKYNELLLYYQKYNTAKVSSALEHKTLYEFVKNQKTNIRNYKQNNEGPFAKDPTYIKFLKYLGVTYP